MPIPVWCIVLCSIALLVALVLFARIRIVIAYKDSFSVYLKFLFFKFRLYPEKKEKYKKTKKSLKPKKKARKKTEMQAKLSISQIVTLIKAMKDVVADFIKSFFGKLHIKLFKIHADIGCEDACKTAIAYGTVTQSVAYALEFLDNISNVDASRFSDIDIRSNFISQKSWVKLNCMLYLRVISLFPLGIKGLKAFFKFKLIKEKLLEVDKDGTIEAK